MTRKMEVKPYVEIPCGTLPVGGGQDPVPRLVHQ